MSMLTEIVYGSSEYDESVALRYEVLRQPLGLQFTREEFEKERLDYHLAYRCEGKLVGCLILVPRTDGEIKMRQVAVAPHAQGQGIGRALVAFAEDFARQRGFTMMTLHARETAVPFYEKLGYARIGERFEEVTLPHWSMRKSL